MVSTLRLSCFMTIAMAALLLSGCAETQLISHWAKKVTWPGQQEAKGTYKIGNPYKIGSVWYYPSENFQLVETGIASWYGPGFHAARTANGEIFDQNELTAAHRTLQLPSLARVTNLENGRSVVVRVNDRGPFKSGRVMDVSKRAAELLDFTGKGTARVRLEVLEKESRILASAARRGEDTTRLTLADLREGKSVESDAVTTIPAPVQQVRTVAADNDADTMPESLRTPMITVEELASPHLSAYVPPQPRPSAYQPPPQNMAAGRSASDAYPGALAPGHLSGGRFMPDPVVSSVPVRPTKIFVQAGSFGVYGNAEKLSRKLAALSPVIIEPVTVNARKLYRVKLGPIASVEAADSVLEKVIRMGNGGAKVIQDKK